MQTLVLIEHDNHSVSIASFCAITAAQQLGNPVTALVIGDKLPAVCQQVAAIDGIESVLCVEHPTLAEQLAERIAPLVAKLATGYTHIVGNADAYGKNILPRVSALLDSMPIADVTAVIDTATFERPIYGGNAIATVKSHDTVKVMTIRTTRFAPAPTMRDKRVPIVAVEVGEMTIRSQLICRETSDSKALERASIIVSGGHGVESKDNYDKLLRPLAKKLGAALAASRLAIDGGFCPNDYLVGQTSKIVAPELYIAIGISGAIQHVNGIKDSKIIVAINHDANAPIFDICDYGLVADLHEIVPDLIEKL